MGVLFALCDLRVSNQDSWRITHTLVRDCLNMTKSPRANIAQRWRQYTAGRPTEVLCGELRQVKGQPIVRDWRRQKRLPRPFLGPTPGHKWSCEWCVLSYRAVCLLQLNKKKLKKPRAHLTYFNSTAFQTKENHFRKCRDIQLKTAAKHKRQSKRPHNIRSTSYLHLLQRCAKGIRVPNVLTDWIREKTATKP